MQRIIAVARSRACARPTTAWLARRGFSTEVAKSEDAEKDNTGVEIYTNTELQNHIRRHETVTPAVYRARLPKDDTASEIANAHGVYGELAGTPRALLDRKVSIYRQAKSSMTSSSHKTKAWHLAFDNTNEASAWDNSLMGWPSTADVSKLLYNLKFDTAEEAAAYCARQGFEYEIVSFAHQPDNFDGEKQYSYNFLSQAVEHKMKRSRKEDIQRKHFGQSRGRRSMWVNLPRTRYGAEEYDPKGNPDQGL